MPNTRSVEEKCCVAAMFPILLCNRMKNWIETRKYSEDIGVGVRDLGVEDTRGRDNWVACYLI